MIPERLNAYRGVESHMRLAGTDHEPAWEGLLLADYLGGINAALNRGCS